MINTFLEWFEGTWENKIQAFSRPSYFAMIRVVHMKVPGTDNMFYGEQAYNYSLQSPYRQFVLKIEEVDNKIVIKNYNFNASEYKGFINLETIPKKLTYKQNCDTLLTFNGTEFSGGIEGCECYVKWSDQNTYFKNVVILGKDYYNVMDQGFHVETNLQIWGSQHGLFEFKKMPE